MLPDFRKSIPFFGSFPDFAFVLQARATCDIKWSMEHWRNDNDGKRSTCPIAAFSTTYRLDWPGIGLGSLRSETDGD